MQEVNSNQEATSNPPSKTSKKRDLLKEVHKFLSESEVFSSFPLSLLLLGLEELIEKEFFICPCRSDLNKLVTLLILIGPALFMFALMYLLLRPFRRRCCCASKCIEKNEKNKNEKNCFNAFLSCLIPPVMWIILFLLDGDYVACGMTDWNGVYKFNNQLNRCWCKPTEDTRNEMVLQDLMHKYIHWSQVNIMYCVGPSCILQNGNIKSIICIVCLSVIRLCHDLYRQRTGDCLRGYL